MRRFLERVADHLDERDAPKLEALRALLPNLDEVLEETRTARAEARRAAREAALPKVPAQPPPSWPDPSPTVMADPAAARREPGRAPLPPLVHAEPRGSVVSVSPAGATEELRDHNKPLPGFQRLARYVGRLRSLRTEQAIADGKAPLDIGTGWLKR